MNTKEFYNELIEKFISQNINQFITKTTFCGGVMDKYKVFENDKIKFIFSDKDKSCEIKRKINKNLVLNRNKDGEIYRLHGEINYIIKELMFLSGMDTSNLNQECDYD